MSESELLLPQLFFLVLPLPLIFLLGTFLLPQQSFHMIFDTTSNATASTTTMLPSTFLLSILLPLTAALASAPVSCNSQSSILLLLHISYQHQTSDFRCVVSHQHHTPYYSFLLSCPLSTLTAHHNSTVLLWCSWLLVGAGEEAPLSLRMHTDTDEIISTACRSTTTYYYYSCHGFSHQQPPQSLAPDIYRVPYIL